MSKNPDDTHGHEAEQQPVPTVPRITLLAEVLALHMSVVNTYLRMIANASHQKSWDKNRFRSCREQVVNTCGKLVKALEAYIQVPTDAIDQWLQTDAAYPFTKHHGEMAELLLEAIVTTARIQRTARETELRAMGELDPLPEEIGAQKRGHRRGG